MKERVLLIDDDANLLNGIRRHLHRQFDLTTAENGEAGLEILENSPTFAVVVCDMRMPGMDGVEVLRQVRELSPHTVRIMLTGNIDQTTAVQAVNEGHIFRFLNKPCTPESVQQAIELAVAQYHLERSEHELLSQTLAGSIAVLTDILALANPDAFARASRVCRTALRVSEYLEYDRVWELKIAARLSQVGCVAARTDDTHPTPDEAARLGSDLIAHIPRLEGVAEIVEKQHWQMDECDRAGTLERLPLGARILKVAIDYDLAMERDQDPAVALSVLQQHPEHYDPKVFAALRQMNRDAGCQEVMVVPVNSIPDESILAADVVKADGTLLLKKGQEIGRTLRHRLMLYAQEHVIAAEIHIYLTAAKHVQDEDVDARQESPAFEIAKDNLDSRSHA